MINTGKLRISPLPPLCAALGVLAAAAVTGGTRETGYQFLWALAFAALWRLGRGFLALNDPRAKRCYGVLGFAFALAQLLGVRLETFDGTGLAGWLWCLAGAAGLCPAAGYLFALLERGLRSLRPCAGRLHGRRVFWLAFGLILLGWLPVYLAYLPGISAYDIYTQMDEVFSGVWTNRNPLLHTVLLGAFYSAGKWLGNPAIGYGAFILAQMLVMAACFAALIRYLYTLRVPKAVLAAALALFALFPVHSMLAISDTKDGLFTALLVLVAIRLHRLTRQPELLHNKRFLCGFAVVGALCCMLRNNAFVGFVLCGLVGLWAMNRAWRKRFVALLAATLVLYFGSLQGLKACFHASGSLSTELVSTQSQQMGRVYYLFHETEPDDCGEIHGYLPTVENYTPYTADPLKTFAFVNKPKRMWGFMKLWGRVGLGHPITYVDAWLLNTKGYWYLNDTTHALIYGEGLESGLGYLLSKQAASLGLAGSAFPWLRNVYEHLFSANEYQRMPVLSLLFAPSLWLWLCAFAFTAAWRAGDRPTRLIIALTAGCFMPLLFGACVLIRYAYPFVTLAPLMLGSLTTAGKIPSKTKTGNG